MISRKFAVQFAEEWIAAWNRHDIERVLSHYADDFEMSSPYVAQIAGEPSGTLAGKPAIRAYWVEALSRMPDLRFDLLETLSGVDSVTLYYLSVRGMAAEVFFFNAAGQVVKAFAHYA
jgi:hypothetical protein